MHTSSLHLPDWISFLLMIFSAATAFLTVKVFFNKAKIKYLKVEENRDKIIFGISILTIFFTYFKSCSDQNSGAIKEKIYQDTLSTREHRYNQGLRSLNADFDTQLTRNSQMVIKLLAEYGYKIDTLHNIITKDTGAKSTIISYGPGAVVSFYKPPLSVSIDSNGLHHFSISLTSFGSTATKVSCTAGSIYVVNGKYNFGPTKQLIMKNSSIGVNSYNGFSILGAQIEGASRVFFYVECIYQKKEGVMDTLKDVATYSFTDRHSGIVQEPIKSEVIALFDR